MNIKLEELMSTDEVVKFLKTSKQTLANDRATKRSIPYTKIGHRVYYIKSEIERLATENYRSRITPA